MLKAIAILRDRVANPDAYPFVRRFLSDRGRFFQELFKETPRLFKDEAG
jgi:hypothetical protein